MIELLLLDEIANLEMKQKDIAIIYTQAIRSTELDIDIPNWGIVNRSIIKRWSRSGLDRVKKMAWNNYER